MNPVIRLINEISKEDLARAFFQAELWRVRLTLAPIEGKQLQTKLLAAFPPSIKNLISYCANQEKEIIATLQERTPNPDDVGMDQLLDELNKKLPSDPEALAFVDIAKVFYIVSFLEKTGGGLDFIRLNTIEPIRKIAEVMMAKKFEKSDINKRFAQLDAGVETRIAKLIPEYKAINEKIAALSRESEKCTQQIKAAQDNSASCKWEEKQKSLDQDKEAFRKYLLYKREKLGVPKFYELAAQKKRALLSKEQEALDAAKISLKKNLDSFKVKYSKSLIHLMILELRSWQVALEKTFFNKLQEIEPNLAKTSLVHLAVQNDDTTSMKVSSVRAIELIIFEDTDNECALQMRQLLESDPQTRYHVRQYEKVMQLIFGLSQKSDHSWKFNRQILTGLLNQLYENKDLLEKCRDEKSLFQLSNELAMLDFRTPMSPIINHQISTLWQPQPPKNEPNSWEAHSIRLVR
ncbi:MAG: hypothetical protein H0W64_11935 [Gammaproteobacteria bacterium]|nr:hypothetical protein [Gammaproteobacteria bacterium]